MSNLNNIISSSSLFANPSFFKGMARSVDLFGTLDEYNYKPTEREADVAALKRDWTIIGRDIFTAIKHYGKTKKPLSST